MAPRFYAGSSRESEPMIEAQGAARILQLTRRMMGGAPITTHYIMQVHGVSFATAKRDLALLAVHLPVNVGRDGRCKELRLRT